MSRRIMLIFCLGIFFLHGILYYAFPEQHYMLGGTGGWIQYIKYLTLAIILFLSLSKLPRLDKYPAWYFAFFVILSVTIAINFFWLDNGNFLLTQFLFCFLAFLVGFKFQDVLTKQAILDGLYFFTLILTLLVIVSEMFTHTFSSIYSRSGFRGVGPFVNPNNTGVVIAIFSVIYYNLKRKQTYKAVSIIFTVLTVALTGSKTAFVVYLFGMFLSLKTFSNKIILTVIFLALVTLYLLSGVSLEELGMREVSLQSANIRTDSITNLLYDYGSSFIQIFGGVTNVSVVDNAYIDILMFGGMFLLLPFITVQFVSLGMALYYKNKVLSICHVMFFLTMLTTNVPRLWPLGYMYWVVVSMSFLLPERKKDAFTTFK